MSEESPLLLTHGQAEDDEIISIADLMSGLMVVFLFIAVVFLRPLIEARDVAQENEREAQLDRQRLEVAQQRVRDIVVVFREAEERLAAHLEREFRDDLRRWSAEFDQPTLTIRFRAPEVLFPRGERQVPPAFRQILSDFLPRYTRALWQYRDDIEEVRVEGHTSSEWTAVSTPAEAFFQNMALSQDRTRAVLTFWLTLPETGERLDWLRRTVTANGLSSSRLWRRPDGTEDPDRSRRVEFRIATRARERVLQVLQEVGDADGRP